MNIADIYAIGCLLVWGASLGTGVFMLSKGKLPEAEQKCKFPGIVILIAFLVAFFIFGVLLAGNPNYLGVVLLLITGFLCIAGFVTLRYRMQELATIFALLGTVGLYFLFGIVYENGFDPKGNRVKVRRLVASSAVRQAAEEDETFYPAGILDKNHPVLLAHPKLLELWDSCGHPRILWHSRFTGLYKSAPLPPFEFSAGTIADNYDALSLHIFNPIRSPEKMEAKP